MVALLAVDFFAVGEEAPVDGPGGVSDLDGVVAFANSDFVHGRLSGWWVALPFSTKAPGEQGPPPGLVRPPQAILLS